MKERVKHTISDVVINKIEESIKYPLQWITIGGNFEITSTFNPDKLDTGFRGNEICLVFVSENLHHTLTIGVLDIEGEITGVWESIYIKVKDYTKATPFAIQKQMLLSNRGLFHLNLPKDLKITNIEVYGWKNKGVIPKDLYGLEEDAFFDVNIDAILKLNTNQAYFILIKSHDGKMMLEIQSDSESHLKFVNSNRDNLMQISHMYTVG